MRRMSLPAMPGGGWTSGLEGAAAASQREPSLSRTPLERATAAGESPVGDRGCCAVSQIVSTAGHEKSGGKQGRPRPKAKYRQRPIAHQYREGTVKSTPARGVKEILKPCASGRSEHVGQPGDGVPFVE